MREQINKMEMSNLREAILDSDTFDSVLKENQLTQKDPERDEVYPTGEFYKDVSTVGKGVNGSDIWIGIQIGLTTELSDELRDELAEIFAEEGFDFSEFTVKSTPALHACERYRITNQDIIHE